MRASLLLAWPLTAATPADLADRTLSITFTQPPRSFGIELQPPSREDAATWDMVAGRPCIRTDRASRDYYLRFRTEPTFACEGSTPVQVTVTWLDRGTGTFTLKYDGAERSSAEAPWSEVVRKTNTGQWLTTVFNLPDANLRPGWRFWLVSNGWRNNDDDECIAEIRVCVGGLSMEPALPLVAADSEQTLALTLRHTTGPGDPEDPRAPYQVHATAGQVAGEVPFDGDLTRLTYRPPDQPGAVTLTAQRGRQGTAVQVLVLPGQGPIREQWIECSHFAEPWPLVAEGAQAALSAAPVAPERHGVQTVDYRFDRADNRNATVLLSGPRELPGIPLAVRLDWRPDGSGNGLRAVFQDSTGQFFAAPLGFLRETGWRVDEVPTRRISVYWLGAADGQWHPPVRFVGLRIENAVEVTGHKTEGRVSFDRVEVLVAAPESAW